MSYRQLISKYRIARRRVDNPEDYDVILEHAGTGYANRKYEVVKNGPGLPMSDLALIADGGNLCFGYRIEGGLIVVYTD